MVYYNSGKGNFMKKKVYISVYEEELVSDYAKVLAEKFDYELV